jgi:hypothetical protein
MDIHFAYTRRLRIVLTVLAVVAIAICLSVRSVEPGFAQKIKPGSNSKSAFKYVDFPHSKHKLQCDSCHKFPSSNWRTVRKEAFPDVTDYPRHESCLKCHRPQFFGSSKPTICSVCHTNPSPRDSSRHPFPNPRELFDLSPKGKVASSDFSVSFPHGLHIEIVSSNRKRSGFVNARFVMGVEDSCKVCHQTYKPQGNLNDEFVIPQPAGWGDKFWLKKGTFKTTPIGHAVCSTCHSEESGILPAPSSCATCHSLRVDAKSSDYDPLLGAMMKVDDKVLLDSWRRRDSSATFRHEWESHADLDCAQCHNVTKINTLDPATKKVDVAACSVCHITATVNDGGILNSEVESRKKEARFSCTKCHLSYGKGAIPESHLRAIASQAED